MSNANQRFEFLPAPLRRLRRFAYSISVRRFFWTIVAVLFFASANTRSAAPMDDPGPTDPVASVRCLLTGDCRMKDGFERSDGGTERETVMVKEPDWWAILMPEFAPRAFEKELRWPVAKRSKESPASTACIASAGLKNIPQRLREQLVRISKAPTIQACAVSVATLTPLRDELYASGYQRTAEAQSRVLAGRLQRFKRAADNYVNACLKDEVMLDLGRPKLADEEFMRSHVGLILLKRGLTWDDARPVCHAARLGHLVITAQHCVPTNSEAYQAAGGPTAELAFRFLDKPQIYPLTLLDLGNGPKYVIEDRQRDYAIFKIASVARELDEEVRPLLGNIELFGDFYNLTANVYVRVAAKDQSPTDFRQLTRMEHSTLCRPAFIGPRGMFMHACHTEAGTSGSPFFQMQNGRLVFVGIHNGVSEALDEPGWAACAGGLPNYGVTITPGTVLKHIPARAH